MNWSDDGGDIYTVFTRDDLLTHATIYWTGNAIASSIRTYANNNRYPWAPSHDRTPVIEAPTGITFVDYENPRESTARKSASSRSWQATAPPGTTTSTSPLTPTAATSSLGDPGTMDHRPGPDLQADEVTALADCQHTDANRRPA